jgi:hypothetical protein
MRSKSLGLIKFFFKGPRSTEDGARFIPSAYRDKWGDEGSSKILQHFFAANATGPEVSSTMLSPVEATKNSAGLECVEDWWEESETETQPGWISSHDSYLLQHFFAADATGPEASFTILSPVEATRDGADLGRVEDGRKESKTNTQAGRILSCYLYLLQRYPNARIPLGESFFAVLVHDVGLPGMLSGVKAGNDWLANSNLPEIEDAHRTRLAKRTSTHWSMRELLRYVTFSTADLLMGEELVAVMSILPGISLRDFSPGLLWLPMLPLWISVIISIVWTFFLWWIGGLYAALFASKNWKWGNKDSSWSGWDYLFAIFFWVLYLAYLLFRLFIYISLVVLAIVAFGLGLGALGVIGFGIYNLFPLRRFSVSSVGPFLILLTNLTVSASIGLFLYALGCFMSIRLLQLAFRGKNCVESWLGWCT